MDASYLPVPGCGILICTPCGGIWKGWPNPAIWGGKKGFNGIPCVVVDVRICGDVVFGCGVDP